MPNCCIGTVVVVDHPNSGLLGRLFMRKGFLSRTTSFSRIITCFGMGFNLWFLKLFSF